MWQLFPVHAASPISCECQCRGKSRFGYTASSHCASFWVLADGSSLCASSVRLQGEEADPEASSSGSGGDNGESREGSSHHKSPAAEPNALWAIVPRVRQRIIDSFSARQRVAFDHEFSFFDAVTSISGTLRPVPKEERRAAIQP